MFPDTGTIYIYEPNESGTTVILPVEETPDNLEEFIKSQDNQVNKRPLSRSIGLGLLALALGGIAATNATRMRLELTYRVQAATQSVENTINPPKPLPPAVPVVFEPLKDAQGKEIVPVNTEFSIIVPKIGINAPVIASVNPANPKQYKDALGKGVAHASTSFTPDQNGTVYLFSHSTNYEWFVKDLNAIFYLVKDLTQGDIVVVYYKGVRYTYELKEKRIVSPKEITYLVPEEGKKSLILQTCWPPGSTTQRLLLFADLVDVSGK